MKILVFGAGVLGCNLANDLFRAGKDVTLLARGTWGNEIKENGLKIKSIFSPWATVSHIPVAFACYKANGDLRKFKLMCATSLGKICASDHAMNAVGEMNALNRDIKRFFEKTGAKYPAWQALEQECGRYWGRNI